MEAPTCYICGGERAAQPQCYIWLEICTVLYILTIHVCRVVNIEAMYYISRANLPTHVFGMPNIDTGSP